MKNEDRRMYERQTQPLSVGVSVELRQNYLDFCCWKNQYLLFFLQLKKQIKKGKKTLLQGEDCNLRSY